MFHWIGSGVVKHWKWCVAVWLVLAVCSSGVVSGWVNFLKVSSVHVPSWREVVQDGEFAFLPSDVPSLQAEELFKKAFPEDRLSSSVVLVVHREDQNLTEADRSFVENELTPKLEELQQKPDSIIDKVRDFNDKQIGQLLVSADEKATLVIIELKNEFLDPQNKPTIDQIEALVDPTKGSVRSKMPEGLHLAMSGAATVGRDMLAAAQAGADSTQLWTVILVIGLLLAIYRAPFVALIPLLSVFISLQISIALLILMTWLGQHGITPFTLLKPFSGLRTYISVVAYGAGVDYCLFLIARYKEEFDRGKSVDEALTHTLDRVGPSLVASAATVACGIGMMMLALFGKFQQAGFAIPLSLVVVLLCSLTFTPAVLRLAGKYAFWPHLEAVAAPGRVAPPSHFAIWRRWIPDDGVERMWEWVARSLTRWPVPVWVICVAAMAPFAAVGVVYHDHLSYGLLSELPVATTSVVGAKAVQEHFAAGETGPLTVLLYHPKVDFTDSDNIDAMEDFIQKMVDQKEELGLSDVRSVSNPLGLHVETSFFTRGVAKRRYLSTTDGYASHVVRIDLVLNQDPFSRDSMQQVEFVERRMHELLPENIRTGAQLHFLGTTPSILDLKSVTDRDQLVIDGSVMAVVFVILVVLLRMFAVSGYLVLSVFFSYFVSLGMTFCLFYAMDPQFAGIDWKVPIFLFTILVAVGEDYNIFLMGRIQEDQQAKGPVTGIRTAMLSTGSIISSCGIIMAGTFFSLVLAGHLRGMQQLGTALTIGVLLDTFIVRPVLVPAWLIMLNTNRFGTFFSHLLGGVQQPPRKLRSGMQG